MYIPDLTERYPEGFRGESVIMDEAPKREIWISFYLQNGAQSGATLLAVDVDDAEAQLQEEYGDMWGGIADYGFYDEM